MVLRRYKMQYLTDQQGLAVCAADRISAYRGNLVALWLLPSVSLRSAELAAEGRLNRNSVRQGAQRPHADILLAHT